MNLNIKTLKNTTLKYHISKLGYYVLDDGWNGATDEEKNILVHEVNGIIDMLSQCDDVDVFDDGEYKTQMLNDLRNDESSEEMETEDVFSATIYSRNGYFVSPKVVD